MELFDILAKKYDVNKNLIKAFVAVRPRVQISSQELVMICNENGLPVLLPDYSESVFSAIGAKLMSGVGKNFIVSEALFFKTVNFPDAHKVWEYYSSNLFKGFTPKRLYINKRRFDFDSFEVEGNSLKLWTSAKIPPSFEYPVRCVASIFINDTLYNVTKLHIDDGDILFLWTTP
jgi:hypothetical protein